MLMFRPPFTRVSDVAVDTWYNCQYPDRPNLCKITKCYIDDQRTGARVRAYKVVTYYDGLDITYGSMTECKSWILERMIGGHYNGKA